MAEYSLTVIIPTFNEIDNIKNIVTAVFDVLDKNSIKGEILVVDDNSKDGTIDEVKKLQSRYPCLNLIVRDEDHGLSQSVAEGFENADADIIQVIDADFSHPVGLIPEFYREIKENGNDVVIGSRYKKGGDIQNWPLKRRIISMGATVFGRMLFPEITDPVSGFFAIKKEILKNASLKPRGYKILMEVLGKGNWKKAKEIPFTFKDREEGESKLRLSTMSDYLYQCIDIGMHAVSHHETVVWREWKKIIKFGIVGTSGIFVDFIFLYFPTEYLGVNYLISAVIAFEITILWNFVLNNIWTFKTKKELYSLSLKKRVISYQAISIVGLAINFAILYGLTEGLGLYYIYSNVFGIIFAFIWNFWANRNITWSLDKIEYI